MKWTIEFGWNDEIKINKSNVSDALLIEDAMNNIKDQIDLGFNRGELSTSITMPNGDVEDIVGWWSMVRRP